MRSRTVFRRVLDRLWGRTAAAWLVLPAIVGFKNILDAGCFFMLVSLGILVVVDLAVHGRTTLPA